MGESAKMPTMARMALCAALVSAAIAMPMLTPDPPGVFCRYKNSSMVDACQSGGACAVKNVTSALDFCEDMYMHDFAVELPYMGTKFTTPYVDGVPGCPSNGVDTLHVPLLAFRTGNRYRSTVCSLTCGKMCERIADSAYYRKANHMTAMVPMCHCKALAKTVLVKIPLQYESQGNGTNASRSL